VTGQAEETMGVLLVLGMGTRDSFNNGDISGSGLL